MLEAFTLLLIDDDELVGSLLFLTRDEYDGDFFKVRRQKIYFRVAADFSH